MKKPVVILIVIVAALLVLSLAKDVIVKVFVEQGVKVVTGLPLNIGGFRAGIINTVVDINNLVLSNPKGFKETTMLDAPEIYVHYDLPAILGGNIHLQEARINIKEFVVVKNEKGELNLDSLKAIQKKEQGKAPAKEQKAPSIKIDSLELKIGKAVYKDYSRGGEPSVQEFNINIDEKYTNITDPNALAALITFKALTNTAISSLANFNIGSLKGTIGNTLDTAQKVFAGATGEAAKALEGATKITGGAVKGAEDVSKGVENAAKDVFNALPFGGKKEQ